eukprot:3467099-Prymnesium_polylepis.1
MRRSRRLCPPCCPRPRPPARRNSKHVGLSDDMWHVAAVWGAWHSLRGASMRNRANDISTTQLCAQGHCA